MSDDDSTDPVGPGTNPNPNPDSQARKKFEQNVYPIIKASGQASDCFSCHSAAGPSGNVTGFVAPDLADAYATATSYQIVVGNFAPSAAGILTKIAAGHQGRTYSQAQIDTIKDWLNTEVTERSNGGGTGGGTGGTNETYSAATARVLNQWSACMSLTNFNAANMAQAWGNMQTNNGERCASCHSTGGYGFMATGIAETKAGGPPGLFTTMATNQYYTVMYYSVDLSDTTRDATGKLMNAKMKVNEDSFKGVAQNIAPHVQHPSFNYTNSQGINALKTFYTSTAAAVAAGNCGTTKLDPPAQ
jgi:mono/diheme cytochrome c family protein